MLLAGVPVLDPVGEAVVREEGFGCATGRFVSRQKHYFVSFVGRQHLGSEADESSIGLFDCIYRTASLGRDEPSRFVHDRRDDRVRVVQFVGDDQPSLLDPWACGRFPDGYASAAGSPPRSSQTCWGTRSV
jgi:hypothetical protein